MSRRTWYRIWFGFITVAAIVTEIWYVVDNTDDSEPWTAWLIRLPWLVLLPLSVGFAGWLVVHLVTEKRKRD